MNTISKFSKSYTLSEKVYLLLSVYPLFTLLVFTVLGLRAYSAFGRIPTIADNTLFLEGNNLLSFFLLVWFYIPVMVGFIIFSLREYRKKLLSEKMFILLQGLFWGGVFISTIIVIFLPSGWVTWWLD